jgi:hypothetical protein
LARDPESTTQTPADTRADFATLITNAGWALRLAWSTTPNLVATRLAIAVVTGLIPAGFVFAVREVIDALRSSASLADAMPWIVIVPVLSFAAVALRPIAAFASSRLSDELQLTTSLRMPSSRTPQIKTCLLERRPTLPGTWKRSFVTWLACSNTPSSS